MKERKENLGSLDYLDFEVTGKPQEEAGHTKKGGVPLIHRSPCICLLILVMGLPGRVPSQPIFKCPVLSRD